MVLQMLFHGHAESIKRYVDSARSDKRIMKGQKCFVLVSLSSSYVILLSKQHCYVWHGSEACVCEYEAVGTHGKNGGGLGGGKIVGGLGGGKIGGGGKGFGAIGGGRAGGGKTGGEGAGGSENPHMVFP